VISVRGNKNVILICCLLIFLSIKALPEELKVGIYHNPPLLITKNVPYPQGIFIDILKEFARKETLSLKFQNYRFHEALNALKNKKIDLLLALAESNLRKNFVNFNKENILINWAVIYSPISCEAKNLFSLHKKKVAMLKGDIYIEPFKKLTSSFGIKPNLLFFDSYDDVLNTVSNNKANFGIVNRFFKSKFKSLKKTPFIFYPTEIKVGFQKDIQKELIKKFDKFLKSSKESLSSTYWHSFEHWLNLKPKIKHPKLSKKLLILILISVIGCIAGFLGITFFYKKLIIKTKEKEEISIKLKVEEEIFKNLLEYSPFGINIFKFKNNNFYLKVTNKSCNEIFQTEFSSLIGISMRDMPYFEKKFFQNALSTLTYNVTFCFELSIFEKYIDVYIFKISSDSVAIMFNDITARKKAEEQLSESERFFMSIFSSIKDGISVLDKNMNIIRVNKIMEEYYEHVKPLVGKKCYEAYHGRTQPCKECPTLETLKTGKSAFKVVAKRDKNWKEIGYLELYTFPLIDIKSRKIKGVIEYVRDISEKVKIENELLKTQKLEALAIFANGIAHDFNNILASALTNLSLAKMDINKNTETYKSLCALEKAILHAKSLVKHLQSFQIKDTTPEFKAQSLENSLVDTVNFVLKGSNIKYNLNIEKNLNKVLIDKNLIMQVFNNIILNAKQAMRNEGTLKITAKNCKKNKKEFVKITFEDTGSGIKKEYMDKIFEPFFTTKKAGSGLGLHMVKLILEKHEGFVEINSIENKGTIVSIYLPAYVGADSQDKFSDSPCSLQPSANYRLLILDDDEEVLLPLVKLLKKMGYNTEFAKNTKEFLKIYENSIKTNNPFNILILDYALKNDINALSCIKKVKKINEDTICILATGYTDRDILAHYKKYGFAACLIKPYRVQELLKVINTLELKTS